MKLLFLFLIATTLFSKVYYSKLEPYEIRNISSNVSGLVLFIDEDMIGKKLSKKPYLKIDSEIDEKELYAIKKKLQSLNATVDANRLVVKNLEKLLDKKRNNYEKIKQLKVKSSVEKDREFYDLIASENQLLSTKKEIYNYEIQIADLKLRKATLLRSLKDKNLVAKDFILYSLAVRPGQVVNIATPLAQVADIRKGKLTIYLDEEDLKGLKEKVIVLNGVETEYVTNRVLRIADSKNISKYMVQIIVDAPQTFSKLIKIELK